MVPGTAQALTSWLLYTHGQAGWYMRAEDMRSSQNAKLSPSRLYISHCLSLSPHSALQPIWRLINPEGLLFHWGFPLFPPTALHPSSPPSAPHSLTLIPLFHHHTYTHTYSSVHCVPASPVCVPHGRHGTVAHSRTEVTDVLIFPFSIFGVI